MSELKVGDLVKLKSSGPTMTIQSIGNNNAHCAWFVGDENKSAVFSLESLEKKLSIAELGEKLA